MANASCGNSESPEATPKRFRAPEFYFYNGSGGKFYRWQMKGEGDNALSDLMISRTDNFERVTKLSDSVWRVRRANKGDVVIKYETCFQPFNEYQSRYEYLFWLARKSFQGVPESALLTRVELETIAELRAPDDSSPHIKLAAAALDRLNSTQSNDHFTKMMPVAMGDNLEKRIEKVGDGRMTGDDLRTFLFVPAKLRMLGAIAVFDLIVTTVID